MIDLAMSQSYPDNFERLKHLSSHFVGNTSPAGVMLQILVGLKDLLEEATRLTPHVIVIDTTSMNKGELGFELKYHKIRLLLPDTIIAIQQGHELEHLLRPWEGSERIKIIRIPASPFTISRSFEHRRQNRHESYLRYFSSAVELKVPLGRLANYNLYEPLENRTAGIYSKDGRCLGLGIILKVEPDLGDMTLLTPVRQRESIWIVRTGKLKLSRECQEII
jgi:polynucleotide 5'-kinase involved in rRNA processing